MSNKHIMPFVFNGGRSVDMDLCCFCKKLKELDHSGDCEYYEEAYVGTTCPGFIKVDNVRQRILNILACRSKTSAE